MTSVNFQNLFWIPSIAVSGCIRLKINHPNSLNCRNKQSHLWIPDSLPDPNRWLAKSAKNVAVNEISIWNWSDTALRLGYVKRQILSENNQINVLFSAYLKVHFISHSSVERGWQLTCDWDWGEVLISCDLFSSRAIILGYGVALTINNHWSCTQFRTIQRLGSRSSYLVLHKKHIERNWNDISSYPAQSRELKKTSPNCISANVGKSLVPPGIADMFSYDTEIQGVLDWRNCHHFLWRIHSTLNRSPIYKKSNGNMKMALYEILGMTPEMHLDDIGLEAPIWSRRNSW